MKYALIFQGTGVLEFCTLCFGKDPILDKSARKINSAQMFNGTGIPGIQQSTTLWQRPNPSKKRASQINSALIFQATGVLEFYTLLCGNNLVLEKHVLAR